MKFVFFKLNLKNNLKFFIKNKIINIILNYMNHNLYNYI